MGFGLTDGDMTRGSVLYKPLTLAHTHVQARFFVQDTVTETPNAAASVSAFRPYSEHGRVEADACSPFTCAAIAPAVGGMPEDEETGAYRVFLGKLTGEICLKFEGGWASSCICTKLTLSSSFESDNRLCQDGRKGCRLPRPRAHPPRPTSARWQHQGSSPIPGCVRLLHRECGRSCGRRAH